MSMFSKLNQIKELRSQAKEMQNTLSEESVKVNEGGVTITMDGNQKITDLDVATYLLQPEKKKNLEKYFMSAHDNAIKKVHKIMAQKIKASGMKLPGMN